MSLVRDALWLALVGVACGGAPALPRPLAVGVGALALVGLLFSLVRRGEGLLRAAFAIACGVVLGHVASAGPLPTHDGWLRSQAALAILVALPAALVALLLHARAPQAQRRGPLRDLAVAAALVLLLLALVPLGLWPLGFGLELATIWRPLAAAVVGLTAGLAMYTLVIRPRRPLVLTAGGFAVVAALSLAQVGTRAPLTPPTRQAFPAR